MKCEAPAATKRGPAGQDIKTWSAEAGICPATYHNLLREDRPKSVRVGARVLIIEKPPDWLGRMAAQGGARTRKWARNEKRKGDRLKLVRRHITPRD